MKEKIKRAIEVLKSGGLILYPTNTVWGIGCDATNKEAVDKIYNLKKRKLSKSFITLVSSKIMLEKIVIDMPKIASDLIELTEEPLTIVYEKVQGISKNAVAKNGSCAIRVTKNIFCKELINKFKKPIISTSANISNENNPRSFKDINPTILNRVDYIVNLQQIKNQTNQPSKIILLKNNGEIKLIR